MAIARGAGTEIIRSIHLSEVDSTARPMIYGVRHHIYTILSCTCYAQALGSAGDWITMYLTGYTSGAGTAQQELVIFKQDMQVDETFVWNDKVSFNGYEPVDFTGPLDSEAKQDAIADQLVSGDSNRQILYIDTQSASDDIDVFLTYIDQNNA
jgi:hypothetical protein